MINACQAEVRPATGTNVSSSHNSNNLPAANKPSTSPATTHDNQSFQDPATTAAVSKELLENKTSDGGDLALVTPLMAAANAIGSSSPSPEMTDLTNNAHLVSMGVAWQAMYHQQQQQQLSNLKTRPFPVPPSITIPPPHPTQTLFSDMDVSMTPRDFGKLSPVFGPNGFPDGGIFALSPQYCQQLASGSVGMDGAAELSSPVKANTLLRPKPVVTNADGSPPMNGASPGSPTVGKDLQFNTRYLNEAWAFDSSPANVYTMLLHQPQSLDLSYQQQMTAAMLAVPQQQQQQLVSAQIQFQLESQRMQHHPGLGIRTTSPLNARMHQVYPQMSPTMATSPHQMPSPHHHNGGAFSPTVNLSMINFSELMMLGGGGTDSRGGSGGGGGAPESSGLFSPTSNILKHILPPVALHHGGVHVKDITLNELRPHFNKPMAVVAKELGVCITLMKKICRRNGLVRWPHRRIRSLVNRITSLQVIAAATATDAEKKRFESQIAVLREELSAVIQNPNEKSRKAQADAKARSPSSLMGVKDEDLDEEEDGGGDYEEAEQRFHQEDGGTAIISGSGEQGLASNPRESNTVKSTPSVFKSLVHRKTKEGDCEGADFQAQKAINDSKTVVAPAAGAGDSKKRKGAFLQQFGGAGGVSLYPPPPIKIPCYRDVRMRRNSAPEQQHLRALGRENSDAVDLERPSSTMSNKRGSISSILCDSAE